MNVCLIDVQLNPPVLTQHHSCHILLWYTVLLCTTICGLIWFYNLQVHINLFWLPLTTIYTTTSHIYALLQYGEQYIPPGTTQQHQYIAQLPHTAELLTQWWNQRIVESMTTIQSIESVYTTLYNSIHPVEHNSRCNQYTPLYYDNTVSRYWSIHKHSHQPYTIDSLEPHDCDITMDTSTDTGWYTSVCSSSCSFADEQSHISSDKRYVSDSVLQRILLECYACQYQHTVMGADASVYIDARGNDEYHTDPSIDKHTAAQYDMLATDVLFSDNELSGDSPTMFYLNNIFNHWQVDRILYTFNYANSLLSTLFTTQSDHQIFYNTFVSDQELLDRDKPYNINNNYIQQSLHTINERTVDDTAYISAGGGGGMGYQIVCTLPETQHHKSSDLILLSSGGGAGGGYRILSSHIDISSNGAQNSASELLYMSSGIGTGAGLQYWSNGHHQTQQEMKQYQNIQNNNHSTDWLNNIVHNIDHRTDSDITLNIGGGGGAGYISRYSNNGDTAISQQYGSMSDIDQVIPDTNTRIQLQQSMNQCIQYSGTVRLVGGGGAGAGGSIKLAKHMLDHTTSSLAELADTISNADLTHQLEQLMKQWWINEVDVDYDIITWFAQMSYRFDYTLQQHHTGTAIIKQLPEKQHTHKHKHTHQRHHTNPLFDTSALNELSSSSPAQHDGGNNDSSDLQGTLLSREIERCTLDNNSSIDWYSNVLCPCINNVLVVHGYHTVLDCS